MVSADEAARLLAQIALREGGAPPTSAPRVTPMQPLWSGMGGLFLLDGRVVLKTAAYPHADAPPDLSRGPLSPARDVASYRCEAAFYAKHAPRLLAPPVALELPAPLLVESTDRGFALCMRKLDGAPVGGGSLSAAEAGAVLDWLAKFHDAFWAPRPAELDGLQPQGTYWYLDTRLGGEFANMPAAGWEGRLRAAARALDERCKRDALQTCVHGDAKAANFFVRTARDGALVAQAFDFQYAGLAPPTKDLAYFLGTATDAAHGSAAETALLERYLATLSERLRLRGVEPPTMRALRGSLDVASADLARFLVGWGWWARPSLRARTVALLDELDGGRCLTEDEYRARLFELRPADSDAS
jgi:hypothetical protein